VASDLHEELLTRIWEIAGELAGRTELPPKVFRDMGGRFVDYVEGESVTVAYPLLERYEGLGGTTQGGILTAAFDNTYGPLAILVGGVLGFATVHLSTTYIRPVTTADGEIRVRARRVEQTRRFLFAEGEATNPKGKLVATSRAEILLLAAPG